MKQTPLSIYIVDDELPIRQDLRHLSWEDLGAHLIGEGSNGEEALQFCRINKPDIVITDITMPVMDGITLTKKLKEILPQTQVIFLTCHDEFDYAQAGIELGIIGYLVKVFYDEEQLGQLIAKARANIEKLLHAQQIHELAIKKEKQTVLTKLMADENYKMSPYETQLIKTPFIPVLLKYHFTTATEYMESIMMQQLELEQDLECVKVDSGTYLLFLDSYLDEELIKEQCNKIVEHLYDSFQILDELLHQDVFFYTIIGRPLRKLEGFRNEYMRLKKQEDIYFYYQKNSIKVSPLLEPCKSTSMEVNINHRHELIQAIEKILSPHPKTIENVLHELEAYCIQHKIGPELLKTIAITTISAQYEKNNISDLLHVKRIYSAKTFDELTHWLEYSYHLLNDDSTLRREVKLAIDIIKSRYAESITLQIIAKDIDITPHYLGRLFKQQTGESFNTYVNRYRIEKALHEIKTTSKKVYEIAEDVGIPSYRYFLVLFKEYTGKTPSDYK